MTEIATIDWFGRCGTSVFFENTAIVYLLLGKHSTLTEGAKYLLFFLCETIDIFT